VFPGWAAHAVSDTAPGLGLDPAVRIDAVGCETRFPVDDAGLALTGEGFILVQAKRRIRRLDPRAADLRSAVDQLVHAMIDDLHVNGVAVRPVDETRDRLVIATNHEGSRSFDVLGRVCERFRGQPPSAPVRSAGVTEEGRTVLEALLTVVDAAWTAALTMALSRTTPRLQRSGLLPPLGQPAKAGVRTPPPLRAPNAR
jgi:hypothetical protein